MSLHEGENNNPFPSGINDTDTFTELPIEDVEDELNHSTLTSKPQNGSSSPTTTTHQNPTTTAASLFNNSHNITKLYSQKIEELLVTRPEAAATQISVIEATKSNENDHPATSRSYVIYTIKIADDIIVKRRYTEFENLRNILVKLFPLSIIPPIPEKQSLTANFSSLSAAVPQAAALKTSTTTTTTTTISSGPSHGAGGSGVGGGGGGGVGGGGADHNNSSRADLDSTSYVDYRKRALTAFLQRCISNDRIRTNFVFLTFLDPHPNFNEFIHIDAVGKLNATTVYKLSPVDPLASLEDETYAQLPIPSDHSSLGEAHSNNNKDHLLSNYTQFESKFKDFETILSNITKYNRNVVRLAAELSGEFTELGSHFNSLSLEEETLPVIEKLGAVFDSSVFAVNQFKNLVNLTYLEKIIELRNFIKVARGLITFNKKKWLQSFEILRALEHSTAILEAEEKVENASKAIDDALSKSTILNGKPPAPASAHQSTSKLTSAGIADDREEEAALKAELAQLGVDTNSSSSSSSLPLALPLASDKLFGYKIPGFKRMNKALASMTDSNPEQTRRQTIARTKLRILVLRRQYALVKRDNELIEKAVNAELTQFREWFKLELNMLSYKYSKDLKEFLLNSQENWAESVSI